MAKLTEFLMRNSARAAKSLPLFHTTQSYNLQKIIDSKEISTEKCDLFKEDLAYFFVGRPAYKKELPIEVADWEFPTCFMFEYEISGVKRVYPFDTGAHKRKKYPSFIQMMDLDEYDITAIADGPQRMIGTFFGTPRNYYRLKSQDEDTFASSFSLGQFDAEVKALHRLVRHAASRRKGANNYVDDRRMTIELQFDKPFKFSERRLLAVVVPEPYIEEAKFTTFCKANKVRIATYQIHPLNPNYYYAVIYQKIYDLLQSMRLM